MRQLNSLLENIDFKLVKGNLDQSANELVFDSRKAVGDSVFFAIVGFTNNGHQYVQQAYNQGCRIFVVQEKVELPEDTTIILVPNTSEALGLMACNYYENPSKKLKLIGITGTNGKTTTTTLLFNLFMNLDYKAGLISTVVNKIGNEIIPSTHTTPNPVELNKLLDKMVNAGCEYCFMEVSSHAVHQLRIAGLVYKIAVFTNITHDHLDYHNTFAEYIRVKKAFFDGLSKDSFALTNADDKNGMVMLQNTNAKKQSFALKTPADFKGKVIENALSGLVMTINNTEVYSRLVGDFNAYNLLAVFGVASLLGIEELEVLRVISNLESVEGRFQYLRSDNGITAIVDYAHTPDALENVLKTIRGIRKGSVQIITVVGCGGDRDKTKRPKMASIAAEMSDKVILTSDNPRTENPVMILEEMEAGLDENQQLKSLTIQDRKQGIKTAISLANAGDIILIAGKGHEKYQEIMGVRHDFDDLKITNELFNQLKK
ncbi:MAG: UDP-N-acetylmuramoyl-L-alanyl-D-glutamate--2,6-diaminopimelate ligase [Bacteroidetes bacterium]|nr:UDP-N-acetylmuramoyl-L-alanyl-D-glutamate--2,6-diaminopimelate ligase [Bacteroidota bacterium]